MLALCHPLLVPACWASHYTNYCSQQACCGGMALAPPCQRQAPTLGCSTSGRGRPEALRFCRASHRRLLFDEAGLGAAGRPCQLLGLGRAQLGLPSRQGRFRRLRLACSAEDSKSGGGGSGSPGTGSPAPGSSGNTSSDESAPERRPQPPKSGGWFCAAVALAQPFNSSPREC